MGESCWAKNVEKIFNAMWLSRDYEWVIGLFEIIEIGDIRKIVIESGVVKNEVIKKGKIIDGVNISVIAGVIGIGRTVINGIAGEDIINIIKGVIIRELWSLLTKKSSKYLSNDKFYIFIATKLKNKEIFLRLGNAKFLVQATF